MKRRYIDLTGLNFGRWTVLDFSHNVDCRYYWKCKCRCGSIKLVLGDTLRSGKSLSCGCLQRDTATKHGDEGKPLYRIWRGIKNRTNPSYKYKIYDRYSGRGISMCEEWNESYIKFRDWALCNGYDEGLTIDRINNDGNYEPSNCRWVNCKIQSNNKSNNRIINYMGKKFTLSQLADMYKIRADTLSYRLNNGWDLTDALTIPPNTIKKYTLYINRLNNKQLHSG